ncbi:putative voltage-gated chloride channel [Fimicolochytrium jonesii]|uniref:putative voltage-gated chloride channel n=1 Tax=Fimicolochytrium jonesii TaxID=1396493 RepID=UPI0022FEFEEF|nr:putative voltage-gated chloride channel [Fimicolochytrium jonesii]KAI8822386.1 putative voltage-gated chloride channel [Fimicolochytrium jonesii]
MASSSSASSHPFGLPYIPQAGGVPPRANSSTASLAASALAGSREVIYEDFTTIDWMKDQMRDYRRQNRERNRRRNPSESLPSVWASKFFNATQSWILISMIGISLGFVAGWIDVVAAWLGDIRFGYCTIEWHMSKSICCTQQPKQEDGSCPDWNDWSYAIFGARGVGIVNWVFYVAFSTLFANVCSYMVVNLAPYAAGSGTAEVKTILGGFIIKGFLGIRTLVIKTIGLPLMVASGLAVGKEGPMIHVACCIANVFPRLFPKYWKNEARKREILSAASGAGVAVAFGAPIGGVLFSLEELSSFFPAKTMVRSFFCALVSTVTLQLMDPYRGKRVLYQVSYSRPYHFFDILFGVVLGVFGGLAGALLITVNRKIQVFRKTSWLKAHPVYEATVISAVTAAFCYFNIFTRVDSSDLLEGLFRECEETDFHGVCSRDRRGFVVASLIMALLMRIVLTIVTFGVKVPAGIFIPSMVWGGLFGRLLGLAVQSWQETYPDSFLFTACKAQPDIPCVTPGMYALLGAIGALGGTTRMTLSLTVVMFELTGTLHYIVPCMVTLMTAKIVGDILGKGGFVEMQIHLNKYPFLDPREDTVVGLTASEVMTPLDELICFVDKGMKVADVDEAVKQAQYKGFPVIRSMDDSTFIGYIPREDLKSSLEKAHAQHSIEPTAAVVFDDPGSPTSARRNTLTPTTPGVTWRHTRGPSQHNMFRQTRDGARQLVLPLDREPLYVHPLVPIEVVMDLFKKMGPRYVLVLHMGQLKGIITKKDILFALYGEEQHSLAQQADAAGDGNDIVSSIWNWGAGMARQGIQLPRPLTLPNPVSTRDRPRS